MHGIARRVFERAGRRGCHYDIHHAPVYLGRVEKCCPRSKIVKIFFIGDKGLNKKDLSTDGEFVASVQSISDIAPLPGNIMVNPLKLSGVWENFSTLLLKFYWQLKIYATRKSPIK